MKTRSIKSLFLLSFAYLFLGMSLPIDGEWKLKKEKDGIQIFTRKVEGFSLKEYKGIMEVSATASKVKSFLYELDKYPYWQHNCASASMVQREGKNKLIAYIHTKAPWPINDRDLVARFTIYEQSNGNFKIEFNAINGYVPEKSSIVRMSYMKGYWLVESQANGKVKITHQVHADPAGKLPDWIINTAVVETPFKTLGNMRAMLD